MAAVYKRTACDICNEEEWTDDDKIVICELCEVYVHQTCYGGELLHSVPDGPWYCQRCRRCLDSALDPEKAG